MKIAKEFIVVKNRSRIHHRGVFAKSFIPKGTRVIEYVGRKLTRAASDRQADLYLAQAQKDKRNGKVYIFELNKRYDIDGNVPYNTAKYINHSCDPNCETEIIRGRIWIIALRDIKKGEEITYNYGYDIEEYEDHPCFCGSQRCVGYIAEEKLWSRLKKKIHKKRK